MATFNKSTSSTTEHLQEPCWQQVPPSPPAFWASDSWRLDRFSMGFLQRNWGENCGNFGNTTVNFYENCWLSMNIREFLWKLVNFYEIWWISMNIRQFHAISMKIGEFLWKLVNFYETWSISMNIGERQSQIWSNSYFFSSPGVEVCWSTWPCHEDPHRWGETREFTLSKPKKYEQWPFQVPKSEVPMMPM